MPVTVTTKKRNYAKIKSRPTIEQNRNYDRTEAALACGCAVITLIRAYDTGNLKAYRIGRRVLHSGAHLLAWLEGGGRTTKLRGGEV